TRARYAQPVSAPRMAPPTRRAPSPSPASRSQQHATSPHLPSFPTRRSSDLRARRRPGREQPPPPPAVSCRPRGSRVARMPGGLRSEEHTSELQSLAYLVCRLLLEKKKTEYTFPRCPDCFHPLEYYRGT